MYQQEKCTLCAQCVLVTLRQTLRAWGLAICKEMVIPRRFIFYTGWSVLLRSSVRRSRLPTSRHKRRAQHYITQGTLVGLHEMAVPGDLHTDIRLTQVEVWAPCLPRLHLP